MEGKTFRFSFSDLKISVLQIENVLGFNEGDDRDFVQSMINEILNECKNIANIRSEYRIFNDVSFDKENISLRIYNQHFNVKKIVFNQIKKAETVSLFLCTAGEEIGKRSRQFMQDRDMLKGYIYDVAGSEIVEAAADLMQAEMSETAMCEGKKITNRYSPGYCGWDVSEQHKLFSFFPDNFCRIKLTPSALMDPEKSVSGIIGIGENVKMNSYTCRICEMKDCIYRKLRNPASS
jgi:hypothetical protein